MFVDCFRFAGWFYVRKVVLVFEIGGFRLGGLINIWRRNVLDRIEGSVGVSVTDF
jgi:hypothetical protein